jgi:exopolysaccharide biosynthesis predicted pyruvyltransferase EpsI
MTVTPLQEIQDETLSILSELVFPKTKVALVDFPNHKNSGDHLIFLGTLRYLDKMKVDVDYIADATRYAKADLDHLVPVGPILLQGGGNFGDRWTLTQEFRERVIEENHDREIIQLSQGIDFREGPLLARAQKVYSAHPRLTLLIRDHDGFAETKRLFPTLRVIYCPDLAFGFGYSASHKSPDCDVVYLRRRDSETVEHASPFEVDKNFTTADVDWELQGWDDLAWRLFHIPGAVARRVPALRRPLYPVQRRAYLAISRLNVRSAIRILSRGETVVTDRLHATVLAALLSKPVIAMDNANGKVAAIVKAYLGRMPGVLFASDNRLAEAMVFESASRGGRGQSAVSGQAEEAL